MQRGHQETTFDLMAASVVGKPFPPRPQTFTPQQISTSVASCDSEEDVLKSVVIWGSKTSLGADVFPIEHCGENVPR